MWKSALAPGEERTRGATEALPPAPARPLVAATSPTCPVWGGAPSRTRTSPTCSASDGLSSTYAMRHLMGDDTCDAVVIHDRDQDSLVSTGGRSSRAAMPASAPGLNPWKPGARGGAYTGWSRSRGGRPCSRKSRPRTPRSHPNYIELLLSETDLQGLRDEPPAEGKPRALLDALLRHALLLEYCGAAAINGGCAARIRAYGRCCLIDAGDRQPRPSRGAGGLLNGPVAAGDQRAALEIPVYAQIGAGGSDDGARCRAAARVPREPAPPEGRQRGKARRPFRRHARPVLAPARRLDHVFATKRLAEIRGDRRPG